MNANSESTYAAAGVDVEAGERAVELMKASVAATNRPEVFGTVGGFAGLFDASALSQYRHPLLATATDGVGTKVAVAQRMDKHDTIGIDLVAMVVDDLVVTGAEPLFMTDYIACGRVVPERIAAIVTGIANGCQQAGCALLGGETAEHPGLLDPDEYDVAGAGTAVVERDELLGPDRVQPGDVLIAMQSSGLHSNGYSLARHVFFEQAGWDLGRHVDEFGGSLGDELLLPTAIYTKACLSLARNGAVDVHAFSHITGGGIAANLARVLPPHLHADIDRATWQPAAVFNVISDLGGIDQLEMERTFNMGIGMVALVAAADAPAATTALAEQNVVAWTIGSVRERVESDVSDAPAKGGGGGSIHLTGAHS